MKSLGCREDFSGGDRESKKLELSENERSLQKSHCKVGLFGNKI
jgi:hypothetical protein